MQETEEKPPDFLVRKREVFILFVDLFTCIFFCRSDYT